ncbi:MAG: hypothetical protein KAT75_00310, partial [Dehalococcoidia bacterium]|nr:hypothetical protein [Dehalococcoidia bacterium]
MKWISLLLLLPTGIVFSGCSQPGDGLSSGQPSGEPVVEHKFVEAGGVRWHYVEAGAGEAVVFLHGLPESWFSW